MNKELHELLGHCWHETEWVPGQGLRCKKCKIWAVHSPDPHYEIQDRLSPGPDYAADPRLVLREMEKREDWKNFTTYLMNRIDFTYPLFENYILDTTGKLRDLAIEWLKEGK